MPSATPCLTNKHTINNPGMQCLYIAHWHIPNLADVQILQQSLNQQAKASNQKLRPWPTHGYKGALLKDMRLASKWCVTSNS